MKRSGLVILVQKLIRFYLYISRDKSGHFYFKKIGTSMSVNSLNQPCIFD